MLAAPPAAAMMYTKQSNGLGPSSYGGGGSVSSPALDPVSCFASVLAALWALSVFGPVEAEDASSRASEAAKDGGRSERSSGRDDLCS